MTKSQQNKAFDTASTQQGQSSGNAQSSYQAATGDIGDYKTALSKYAAENPYTAGGSYQTATNQRLADVAAGGAQGTQQAIQASMVRSGGNPSAGVAAGEEVARENARTSMDASAKAEQDRAQGLAGYNAGVLQATAKPEEMEADLMKGQLQGEQGALGQETEGAKQPSFWQQMGTAALQAGVGFASCPAAGSLYLLADGKETEVENLRVGDQLLGIDGEPQTIEEIETGLTPVFAVRTESGLYLRCSRSHAFALPGGGFVSVTRALRKQVVVGCVGSGKIVSIEPDGVDRVFNVITDGGHTYRANGFWSLGVGEAEREVTIEDWNRIAERVSRRAPAEVL